MEDNRLTCELYFLVAKFLKNSPCQGAFEVLLKELEEHKLLPKRVDWTGNFQTQLFEDLERQFRHIKDVHLLEICKRINPLLQLQFKKTISYLPSVLGNANHSVLKEKEIVKKYFSVEEYCVRRHRIPLLEPVSFHRHNFVKALCGREISGPFNRKHFRAGCQFKNMELLGRTLGHLSAVYCVVFDSSSQYIVTGADDLLVKIWHAVSGRLLYTLRGASAEITDLAINYENTLLAAGSVDKVVRVWCLQTAYPVATLIIHTGLITSVNFCPSVVNGCRYLASTATDGSVAFWKYATDDSGNTTFELTPVQYLERMRPGCAQILCGSFSAGGMFLATGSADHNVRVYKMAGLEGPTRVLEKEAHSDRVDSIQWAHTHLKFASGSKDGTCIIWYYEQQQWKSKILLMSAKLPWMKPSEDDAAKQKLRVTMLSWDRSDQWVITASSDSTIRVWDSRTGELLQALQGHKAETYVIESHPLDSRVLLSAGHDGKIFLWNIITGEILVSFQNNIDGQGFGAVFDAKWSPDGTMFAATDSHGHILTFGFGAPDVTRKVPPEMFFHTDYRPLTRDNENVVLDEQTNMQPHLMPPPFLVDVDGNPYPPYLQRLVPGREYCDVEQLVPNVVLSVEGRQEVIMGADHSPFASQHNRSVSRLRTRVGMRRSGDIEGIRQSSGNWQRGEDIPWSKHAICEPLDKYAATALAEKTRSLAYLELEEYRRESKKPIIQELVPAADVDDHKMVTRHRRKKKTHSYRTRASRTEQLEMEFENPENLSPPSDGQDENYSESEPDSSSTSSDEVSSSDYSDWTADHGMNKLEPPRRVARTRRVKRATKFETARLKKPSVPQDIPEEYRPPDWLSEVCPKKAPYIPQMGDEVMFFQQGYNLYLNAVQSKNIYKVRPSQLNPWGKIKMKDPQLVKVIGIKYEIRPPRLCGLRLAIVNEDDQLTPHSFDLKYHDISDVIDFLVLRQVYDTALARNWKVGDRFRSIIDDAWWCGKIVSQNKNAQSPFLCYRIVWDNNEHENLSPWDLEPANSRREPQNGSSMPVLPREMKNILYQPLSDEWPGGNQDDTCDRIIRGLEELMSMALAEDFLVPVDFNVYPSYAYVVEYPIDLSTIKARLENRYYRRLAAVQFDARYIASNAEKFNERGSDIVKRARIVTDILLKIIKANIPLDVTALCRELQDNYFSAESDEEEEYGQKRGSTSLLAGPSPGRRNLRSRQPFDWKQECKALLQMLWLSEDSEPFRQPVDRLEHPDYDKIVDTPMDLSIIREELNGNNYNTPVDFCKDIRVMFQNAKNYTPNKRSRIYAMTVRLSSLAEEHIKRIMSRWRSTRRNASGAETGTRQSSRLITKQRKRVKEITTDDDQDDEEDEDEEKDDDEVENDRFSDDSYRTREPRASTSAANRYKRTVKAPSADDVVPDDRPRRAAKRQCYVVSARNSKKTPDSTEESEVEPPPLEESSSRSTRNLRARKLRNYAKMLASDTDMSDEEMNNMNERRRRRGILHRRKVNVDPNRPGTSGGNEIGEAHRHLRQRRVCHYVENSDSLFEDDEDDDEYISRNQRVNISVSVSSRGRIRKLTAKARAYRM